MGVNLDLKADATQAMTNTSKNLPKGIGRVWNLLCGKKEAEIKRQKALIAAQTQKEYELVLSDKADFVDGEFIPKSDNPDFATQVQSLEQEQEIRNLVGNVGIALEELRNIPDEEISDEEVDPDFFARWRREAKVIGNLELQVIWGKILAEEIKQPDTISFRALDVIKNLTREEAEVFCEAARYVVNNIGIIGEYRQGEFEKPIGNILRNLLMLEECNLVTSISTELQLFPTLPGQPLLLAGYEVYPVDKDLILATRVIPLSPVGQSLLGIIDRENFPETMLEKLAEKSFFEKGEPHLAVMVSVVPVDNPPNS